MTDTKELSDTLDILIKHEDPKGVEVASKVGRLITKEFNDVVQLLARTRALMDDARLLMLYKDFDLEATRRERDELKEEHND